MSDDKKNKTIGLVSTVGVHLLLLAFFFFVLAWKEPDPPLPEYGIELNFGLEQVGTGETPQPQKTEVVEEEPEEIQEPEEEIEEVVEEQPEPVAPEPVEEVEEPTEVQPEESPAPVEEAPKPQPKAVVEKKPVEKTTPPKEVAEKPKEAKNTANQGDDADKVGDKGEEEGKIDARAIYGAKGADKGASLQMTGWNWDYIPRPDDQSSESGKIVFQITIDGDGYVTRVVTVEKTVSPAVEKVYREEVERLTFSPTSENTKIAPLSTGKITFIIRAR